MTVSAFPQSIAQLARQLQEAAVDHEAFEMPLPLCRLHECKATCCHDGVVLSDEEVGVLGHDVISLPDGRKKTRTIATTSDQRADDFPEHFPNTRCVFLDDQYRCQWQLKSVSEGKHPWFYKPISCWMHPLLIENQDGRPLLTIRRLEHDVTNFATHTPCGRMTSGAQPARKTLKMELEMLTEISGRDFLRELNALSF